MTGQEYRHRSARRFAWGLGLAVAAAATTPAWATFGYFADGYGVQSEGLAGAAIAYPKDSLAIATNPASLFALGDRFDVGADLFIPDRGASIVGNAYGADQSYDGSGVGDFLIPQIGYTHLLDENWAVGIAVYGNGGMNTSYRTNPYGRFGATGEAGVNLEQLFVSPTIAYRLAEGQSIGVSFNLGYQLFKADGVGIFGGYSSNPAAISNRNSDHAYGYGARVGYQGQLTSDLTVGAFWQSKTYFARFKKYAGLFAGQGGFDAPSSYGVGLGYKLTPDLDAAVDFERIEFSDVPSVGNPLSQLFAGNPFGGTNGPGFGWRDANIIKLGLNYTIDPHWQIRAGYGYTTQPVPASQTFLNILAPGVVQNHITAGATWTSEGGTEVSGVVLYAPRTTVDGSGSIPSSFGGGEANVRLSEVIVGLSVGWHLEP